MPWDHAPNAYKIVFLAPMLSVASFVSQVLQLITWASAQIALAIANTAKIQLPARHAIQDTS